MLTFRKTQQGATLIELVIGLVIIGIVFAMSAKTFGEWIVNSQIRSAAEALQNGLQVTRNEAIRSNINVEFRLGTGTGWTVVRVSGPNSEVNVGTSLATVQSRAKEEGSPNVTVGVLAAGATKLTFTSLGRVATTNADASAPITRLDVGVPATVLNAVQAKNLSILITSSQIRMCDPNPGIPAGEPRHC